MSRSKRYYVARADRCVGLVNNLTIDADLSSNDCMCGKRPALEKSCIPQPFVESLFVGCLAQLIRSSSRSLAKGESASRVGELLFSRLARADRRALVLRTEENTSPVSSVVA